MRKIVVLEFITLDGVIQAGGGPEEDTSGGFKYGGWQQPYSHDFIGKVMSEQMSRPFDLLLGRKTYEIFASYWPKQANEIGVVFNKATKYVVTHSDHAYNWEKTVVIKDNKQELCRKNSA